MPGGGRSVGEPQPPHGVPESPAALGGLPLAGAPGALPPSAGRQGGGTAAGGRRQARRHPGRASPREEVCGASRTPRGYVGGWILNVVRLKTHKGFCCVPCSKCVPKSSRSPNFFSGPQNTNFWSQNIYLWPRNTCLVVLDDFCKTFEGSECCQNDVTLMPRVGLHTCFWQQVFSFHLTILCTLSKQSM